jgi:hypothetical protein
MSNKKVTVFMDGVDWDYEVGEASDGNRVYPDLESIKKYNKCWEGCGVVECKLVFKKWVVESDWGKMMKTSKGYTQKELKENRDLIRLEGAERHLKQLEQLVDNQKHKVVSLKANLKKKEK